MFILYNIHTAYINYNINNKLFKISMNFLIKYKKIFLIMAFIITVIMLGYLLYAVFFKASTETKTAKETATSSAPTGLPKADEGSQQIIPDADGDGLPDIEESPIKDIEDYVDESADGGLTKTEEVSQNKSLSATLGNDGSTLQYYNKEDGKFYRITENGEAEAYSDKVFYNLEKVTWSPQKNKAILEYPDGSNIVYNFDTKKQITLPKHWEDFNFSPDGSQIVLKSIGIDPDNRWLAISNEDASKIKAIESIGLNDATVYPLWSPNNQIIAMYTEGVDFNRQEVYFVGQNDENFKSTVIEGRGFQPQWSPNGDRLLYSVYSSDNDYKPLLWIVNAEGEKIGSNRKSLGIETWAEKCVFNDSRDIYCAVPDALENGSGIFPEMAENTQDKIYKIDSITGLKKLLAVPDGAYNASNLIISEDQNYLFFTDKTTEKIYKINLK